MQNFKSWKTTLTGLVGAIWLLAEPIVKKGDFNIKIDWPQLVGAILVGMGGFLAKDHDVTGNPAVTIGEDVPEKPKPAVPKPAVPEPAVAAVAQKSNRVIPVVEGFLSEKKK